MHTHYIYVYNKHLYVVYIKNAILVLFISDRNIGFLSFFLFFYQVRKLQRIVYVFFSFTTICISKFCFSKDLDKSINDFRTRFPFERELFANMTDEMSEFSEKWAQEWHNWRPRLSRRPIKPFFHFTIALSLFFFQTKAIWLKHYLIHKWCHIFWKRCCQFNSGREKNTKNIFIKKYFRIFQKYFNFSILIKASNNWTWNFLPFPLYYNEFDSAYNNYINHWD